MTGLTLNNSAGDAANSASDGKAAAHNSDGFDFSSSNNVVLSNTIVMNQDDCVAVTSGENITVTGMTCSGGQYVYPIRLQFERRSDADRSIAV